MADKIQVRQDTADNWSSNNPVLSLGEQGWESDTNKFKIGDGSTVWNSLGYFHSQDYLSSDPQLTDIAGLTPTDSHFIIGDGSNFVTETGATARASLGLTIGTDVLAHDANLTSFVDTFTLPTTDGTADQVLTTDGSGTLSFSTASSGGSFEATASGTLADGNKVVVNSDGTVSAVTSTSRTEGVGTAVTVDGSTRVNYLQSVVASNNKVVFIWSDKDDSYKGKVAVGTISGTSISVGSPVTFNTNGTYAQVIGYDPDNDKIVVFYRDAGDSNYAKAKVGTISGTSISFGSATTFATVVATDMSVAYDTTANKFVLAYSNNSSSNQGIAIVGTVSGTSISFGSATQFSSLGRGNSVVYDSSNDKTVILYRSTQSSGIASWSGIVGTVSGTSISFGSATEVSGNFSYPEATFDSSNNKVVVTYAAHGSVNSGVAVVGTVSGTSISFGSQVEFYTTDGPDSLTISFDSANNKVIIFMNDNSSDTPEVFVGTVSGTSISFSSSGDPLGSTVTDDAPFIDFDTNTERMIISYMLDSDDTGRAATYQTVDVNENNLTATNYAGIVDAAYSDGATATVQLAGTVDDAQSGLTAGQKYYVQNDGTLSTTPDTPSVVAGVALSSTELLLKPNV